MIRFPYNLSPHKFTHKKSEIKHIREFSNVPLHKGDFYERYHTPTKQ